MRPNSSVSMESTPKAYTYLGFEFLKLQTTAVELDKTLPLRRITRLVRLGCGLDGGRRLALD